MTDGEEFRCHPMILSSFPPIADDSHDDSDQQAEENAGRQRKIESKILPFNHDIPRQPSEPGNRWRQQPAQTDQGHQHSGDDQKPGWILHLLVSQGLRAEQFHHVFPASSTW